MLDILDITFVINSVSSTEAEKPLVEVEAFPTIAPIELTVEQEFVEKKISKKLIIFTN
jgi:hypothetical protein|tara:strand:+ start:1681 stop:1854 length:174 start_codon:yes stop_codon:yes gene_type:complete